MEQKQLWAKISGSINFFIKGIWKKQLLKSNEDLLKDFIHYSLVEEEPRNYKYLDKKNFEYISLDDKIVEKIRIAFLDRIEKKKLKYADEIQRLKLELEKKKDKISNLDNVVEFSKYKK